MFHPTLAMIREAARRLQPFIRKTPVLPSNFSPDLFFKAESLQLTGSFKIRTALHQLLRLSEKQRQCGIVASSSGNFAQGVALAGKLLGAETTVVMMRSSNPLKVERTRALGSRVVFCGDRFQARQEEVERLRREEGCLEVHPYDRPDGILGNATLGLETAEQLPGLRHAVIPISGGGLIAGVACALKALVPAIRIWGVQPLRSNATQLSFQKRRVCSIAESRTIADGLRVTQPGEVTFPLIQRVVDDVVAVKEASIRRAVGHLLWEERLLVEPSGAVTLAAVMEEKVPVDNTVLVLSGGNIDPGLLAELAAEGPGR